MITRTLALSVLMAFHWASALPSQVDDTKLHSLTRDELRAMLTDLGFAYEQVEPGSRSDLVRVDIRTAKVAVLISSRYLQFFAGFSRLDEPPRTNDRRNKEGYDAKTFVDNKGNLVVEIDVDLAAGISRADLATFIRDLPRFLSRYANAADQGRSINVDAAFIESKRIPLRQRDSQKSSKANEDSRSPAPKIVTPQEAEELRDSVAKNQAIIQRNQKLASLVDQGRRSLQFGQYDSAFEYLSEANRIDSTQPLVWRLLAQACLGLTRSKSGEERNQALTLAVDTFKRAIELNTDNADLRDGYARVLAQLRRFDDAAAECERAVQLDPIHRGQYYYTLGAAMIFAGRNDEAINAFKSSAEGGNAEGYYRYGSLLGLRATPGPNHMIPPEGATAALLKYVQLMPDGANVKNACEMLWMFGASPDLPCKDKFTPPQIVPR